MHLRKIAFLFLILLIVTHNKVIAHGNCEKLMPIQRYNEIWLSKQKLEGLTQDEFYCYMRLRKIFKKNSPPTNSEQCEQAWNEANDAGDELIDASRNIIDCVESWEHKKDCRRESRNVDSAQSDYSYSIEQVEDNCFQ